MTKKFITGLGLSLAIFGFSTALPLVNGEISVGYMQQKPNGWLQYDGDTVDLKKDLGFDDENKGFVKAKLELPIPLIPNIYLQYIPMDFKGDRNTTFRFDGKTFTGNVHSEVTLDHYDIGLYYNVPMISAMTSNVFDAEVGLIVRVIDFEAKVSDGTNSSKTDFTAPIPMLYAGLTINPFNFLSIVGEAKGITYNDNYYYDFSGELRFKFINAVVFKPFISLGYKIERLRIDDIDNTYGDIRIEQPYVSFGINF